MNIMKNSMISVATATVLMTGFTGCSSDTNNLSTESGISQEINAPKGTVTGTVLDTNGNPLIGVKVFVAGMETLTDAGGVYTVDEVRVLNTESANADDTSNGPALAVTILAPEGYLGATVTVRPEAQQISSSDDNDHGGDVNPNTNFIDGYTASAGTAVLPKLDSTVTGRLEMDGSEASVANTSLALDFRGVAGSGVMGNIAQQQDGVVTTYSTTNFTATTDAMGHFTFTNIPSDSILRYVVGNYVVIGEERGGEDGANQDDPMTVQTTLEGQIVNVGDVRVTPVITEDDTSPFITVVTENTPAANVVRTVLGDRLMLEDDVTASRTFVVNFSESIEGLSEDDKDMTESITVYSHSQLKYLTATAKVISGNKLEITMSEDLLDAEVFDVNLLITDFKDTAGNHLDIQIDQNQDGVDDNRLYINNNAGNGQAVRIQLLAYTNLNLQADPVENQAQMEKDTLGTSFDGLDALRSYSNAFNDVNLPLAQVQQLNTFEAFVKLNILNITQFVSAGGNLANYNLAVNSVNTARITFTPSGASAYQIRIKNSSGTVQNVNIANNVGANSNAAVTVNSATLSTVIAGNDNSDVELVLNGVSIGDVVSITPLDDYGYTGMPRAIVLEDNVAPTTKTQPSYAKLFTNAGTDAGVTIAPFGDGGELANFFGVDAPIGTPILGVTPGLLDNLDANGNDILAENEFTVGDETLRHELELHNGRTNPTDPLPVINFPTVYDATAFAVFSGNLDRRVGVAFTEDIDLTGVTPTYNGTDINMDSFTAKNNILLNDSGNTYNSIIPQGVGFEYNNDLAAFTTGDVIALANNNHGKVLSFDGIKDANGNVADNADVVVQDRMPPFIVKSSYNSDGVEVNYNEPISAPTDAEPLFLWVADSVDLATGTFNGNFYAVVLTASNQMTGTVTNWELSTDGKQLTVSTSGLANTFVSGNIPTNQIVNLFTIGDYIEPIYDTTVRGHAMLATPTARDRNTYNDLVTGAAFNNSWANWKNYDQWAPFNVPFIDTDLESFPIFAAVDMIGPFNVLINDDGFVNGQNAGTTTQTIVWEFSHPLAVDITSSAAGVHLFDTDEAGVTPSSSGIITASLTRLEAVWTGAATVETTLQGFTTGPSAFTSSDLQTTSTEMVLSADHKTVTFKFRSEFADIIQDGDEVAFAGVTGTASSFQSALINDEILNVSGNSND